MLDLRNLAEGLVYRATHVVLCKRAPESTFHDFNIFSSFLPAEAFTLENIWFVFGVFIWNKADENLR